MKKLTTMFLIIFAAVCTMCSVACNSSDTGKKEDDYPNNASQGLEFKLSSDESYYSLEGIGICMDEEIVIPSMFKGKPVKVIAEEALENSDGVKKIIVPDSVIKIEDSAFIECRELIEVRLPDSLTTIPESCFRMCYKLETVNIPSSLKKIGNVAFVSTAIKEIEIPDSVTLFGDSIFQYCSSLRRVVLPSGMTAIPNQMFLECENLSDIVLPQGIKKIGSESFGFCKNLKEIVIPDDTETIEGLAFLGCGIEKITIGKSVKHIAGGSFSSCSALSSVIFKNLKGWTVSYSDITEQIPEVGLSDVKKAAEYLTTDYPGYSWQRA